MQRNGKDPEPFEQELIEALRAGTIFGPRTRDRTTWPMIHAGVIRNLLRGGAEGLVPDPKGLRLRCVRIIGRIDLDHLDTSIPLELDRCDLPGGLTASRGVLPALRLHRLKILRSSTDEAVIDLGELRVGKLSLTGTSLINRRGPALVADRLKVDSHARFDEGFSATGHGELGAVHILGARIAGQLKMNSATLYNDSGPALAADQFTVESNVYLSNGFNATGYGELGAVRLPGAKIAGQLQLGGATLRNDSGPALLADGLFADSDIFLDEDFSAAGYGELGAVRLPGAKITGQLSLQGARLKNKKGPALLADGLVTESSTYLGELSAAGHGEGGTVRMPRASIGGQLDLTGASLTNMAGPALNADGLVVKAHLRLGDGFTTTGGGKPVGSCPANASPCEGRDLRHTRLPETNSERCFPTVVLTGAKIGSELTLSDDMLTQEASSGRWVVDGLTYMALGADAHLWLAFLRHGTHRYSTQPYQQFAAVAREQGDERLAQKILIAQHSDLVARSRRQSALLTRRQCAWQKVLWATVGYGYRTWLALAWLALVVGVALVATFAFGSPAWSGVRAWWPDLAWVGSWWPDLTLAALEQPPDSKLGGPGGPCRNVDLVVLGLKTIPLVPLVSGPVNTCTVTDTSAGIIFLSVSVALKIAAWALITLFVAGYTNVVRKPGP